MSVSRAVSLRFPGVLDAIGRRIAILLSNLQLVKSNLGAAGHSARIVIIKTVGGSKSRDAQVNLPNINFE